MSANPHTDPRRDCIHTWSCNQPLSDEEYFEQLKARFWAKVDKNGPVPPHRPELGPCWVWTGSVMRHRDGQNYGQLGFRWPNGSRRPIHAHVASFYIHTGSLPELHVLHRCDNPPCVNPNHLWEGTHKQNMYDMHRKGRAAKPMKEKVEKPKHRRVRFTPEQTAMIKAARLRKGLTIYDMGAMLDLDFTRYFRLEHDEPSCTHERAIFLIRFLEIDEAAFGLRQEQIYLWGGVGNHIGRKRVGDAQRAQVFGNSPHRPKVLSKFWRTLPKPRTDLYRADLLCAALKGRKLGDIKRGATIQNSDVEQILLGIHKSLDKVLRVARFAGLSESQVFNTQKAAA
jgi:hypothetical protein